MAARSPSTSAASRSQPNERLAVSATRTRAQCRDAAAFLHRPTPGLWFEQAAENLPTLLVDHANCEKKAAGTALSLIYRYVDRPELLQRLSRLAREELRHFEQVHTLLCSLGIEYRPLSPGRYAASLKRQVRTHEPARLVDTLLMGAIVEARSCERFAGLVEVLPDEVGELYAGLMASEVRHFRGYLALAERYAGDSMSDRLDCLLTLEAELATKPDTQFRFHSGPIGGSTPAG